MMEEASDSPGYARLLLKQVEQLILEAFDHEPLLCAKER